MGSIEPFAADQYQIDRFPLLGKIGQGGFGEVYLAHDPRLGGTVPAKVAIKVLLSGMEEHQERFLQEAQLMRQLGPGTVEVYEFGEFEDPVTGQQAPYFVMEYCERGTLADRLNELGRGITASEAVGLVEAIAASARTLALPRQGHPHGIVHRDIKPSNFLIRTVERREATAVGELLRPDEQLMLTDFSIAKPTSPEATDLTLAGGTPAFGAPEQFYQEDGAGNALPPRSDVDPSVDVYAASVVVLSALSNSFRRDSTSYSDADFAAAGPLERELRRGMSHDPGKRHPDFDTWRDALVGAYRRSEQRRARGRLVAGLAAAIGVCAVAVLAWSSLGRGPDPTAADLAGPTADRATAGDAVIGSEARSANADDASAVAVSGAESASAESESAESESADQSSVDAGPDQTAVVSATTEPPPDTADQTTVTTQATVDPPAANRLVGLGGLCMEIPNQNGRNGQNLWIWDCNDSPAQNWVVDGDRIVAMGRCLDIEGPDPDPGAMVQIWECQNVPQHGWRISANGEIVSTWNGLCVAVAGDDANRGTPLQMAVCDGSEAQRWQPA
ncbi:MAG: serine/threonine protein kinase [Actinomycetota bacterium]